MSLLKCSSRCCSQMLWSLTGWLGLGFRVCGIILIRMEGDSLFIHSFSLYSLNETKKVFIWIRNRRQWASLVIEPGGLTDTLGQNEKVTPYLTQFPFIIIQDDTPHGYTLLGDLIITPICRPSANCCHNAGNIHLSIISWSSLHVLSWTQPHWKSFETTGIFFLKIS